MKLLIKDIVQETNDTLSICFKNGNLFKKLKYKPGQFLTIRVPINGTVQKRAYSFSSNPYTDKDLKITIKRVQKGLVSNFVHDNLKVGDRLEVDDPSGSFYVEPSNEVSRFYVFFAGGSGITPIISIIKSLLSQEPKSKILLIYANQSQDAIIFHSELKKLEMDFKKSFSVEYIISSDSIVKDNYHPGFVSLKLMNSIFVKHSITYDDHVYMICGPFGYMEKIKEILAENGISREKIKIEVFKSPVVKVNSKNLISDIILKHNNQEHHLKVKGDQSILQQAMSENIVIPSLLLEPPE